MITTQISRLMRELTRVEAERDKARDDLKGYDGLSFVVVVGNHIPWHVCPLLPLHPTSPGMYVHCYLTTGTSPPILSAEVARLASEELVRDMKQRTGQQLRELQVDRGEVQRSLSEHQQAAEKRERQLTVWWCCFHVFGPHAVFMYFPL